MDHSDCEPGLRVAPSLVPGSLVSLPLGVVSTCLSLSLSASVTS